MICPKTKVVVKYDDVKDKVKAYSKMPIKYKQEKLESCNLVDLPLGTQTENEMIVQAIGDSIVQLPFLYE